MHRPHDHERTASAQPEHLTYTEAAARLGITPNAVRMRAARGTLASVRIDERTLILWPQPGPLHTPHESSAQEPAPERTERADERLIETLQAEVSYLRQQLDAEVEARRRADHIILELSRRPPELETGEEATVRPIEAPLSVANLDQASEGHRSVSDTLRLRWRRWWRRITGDG